MTGLSHETLVEFRGLINAIEATMIKERIEQNLKDIIKLAMRTATANMEDD